MKNEAAQSQTKLLSRSLHKTQSEGRKSETEQVSFPLNRRFRLIRDMAASAGVSHSRIRGDGKSQRRKPVRKELAFGSTMHTRARLSLWKSPQHGSADCHLVIHLHHRSLGVDLCPILSMRYYILTCVSTALCGQRLARAGLSSAVSDGSDFDSWTYFCLGVSQTLKVFLACEKETGSLVSGAREMPECQHRLTARSTAKGTKIELREPS